MWKRGDDLPVGRDLGKMKATDSLSCSSSYSMFEYEDEHETTADIRRNPMHPLAELTVPTGAVAIHWFEQSCYAIKDEYGTIVQIDPYFPRERPADRFLYPDPPVDEATLPTDFVLLTHDHRDHTWPDSLERIHQSFPTVKMVGPKESIANVLANTSVKAQFTTTIEAGMGVDLRSMTAYAVYAKPPQGSKWAAIRSTSLATRSTPLPTTTR
jgi:hypothetical protein